LGFCERELFQRLDCVACNAQGDGGFDNTEGGNHSKRIERTRLRSRVEVDRLYETLAYEEILHREIVAARARSPATCQVSAIVTAAAGTVTHNMSCMTLVPMARAPSSASAAPTTKTSAC
jgi:hypothetical protein